MLRLANLVSHELFVLAAGCLNFTLHRFLIYNIGKMKSNLYIIPGWEEKESNKNYQKIIGLLTALFESQHK